MHGYCAINFAAVQQLVHLGVAFFIVGNFNGGNTGIFQRTNVVHIYTSSGSSLSSSHGVFFPMLATHAGKSNLRTGAKLAGFDPVGHLHEDARDFLFQRAHVAPPYSAASSML